MISFFQISQVLRNNLSLTTLYATRVILPVVSSILQRNTRLPQLDLLHFPYVFSIESNLDFLVEQQFLEFGLFLGWVWVAHLPIEPQMGSEFSNSGFCEFTTRSVLTSKSGFLSKITSCGWSGNRHFRRLALKSNTYPLIVHFWLVSDEQYE